MENTLCEKREALLARLADLGKDGLLVAFSGGVDSSLLAAAAQRSGVRVELATSFTPLHSQADEEWVRRVSDSLALPLHRLSPAVLDLVPVAENHPDRCYHCKRLLFRTLLELGRELGLGAVAEGANADDLRGFRPGLRAGDELGVARPLAEVGLGKAEIRALAREWGLACWSRPSNPCLASRFPYHTALTEAGLRRVEAGEARLARAGLSGFRLRCHGDLARIECPPEQLPLLLEAGEALCRDLRELGFSYITYDLEGFRSGSFDR